MVSVGKEVLIWLAKFGRFLEAAVIEAYVKSSGSVLSPVYYSTAWPGSFLSRQLRLLPQSCHSVFTRNNPVGVFQFQTTPTKGPDAVDREPKRQATRHLMPGGAGSGPVPVAVKMRLYSRLDTCG